ncbi:hypothetical protein N7509_008454 [Penicillium cosmopolitanum]|uniref:Uncharacterized protein n=1 Tax=Penicillium cosmopolitanum TaxID=1131564 RepID=A0A9W9VMK6_9EURO|nr:uncharacterized protein N7509_008454 [Penicillium cosmopolitanum]KAJ5385913.1 hypothetical protein N7509_008454 [Penicillium cosmopolitanum]
MASLAPAILLLTFSQISLAQAVQTEGWQFADNSRSSWDIFWTCVSTILACTWTALHLRVPKRSEHNGDTMSKKLPTWTCALLAPELMAMVAVMEHRQAMTIVTRCNTAFQTVASNEDSSRDLPLHTASSSSDEPSSLKRWTAIQGFCIDMRGAILITEDEWTYPVLPSNVVPLIETGVIKHSHLRERDIQDRAKADSLAKALTMLQTFWVTCNIIARAAYNLPITPLEISTVAYAVCAAITYGVWWHKPKDMVTPITIYLPYGRESDTMPRRVRDILDQRQSDWVHLSKAFPEDSSRSVFKKTVTFPLDLLIFIIILCLPVKWFTGKHMARRDSSGDKVHSPSKSHTNSAVSESKELATPEQNYTESKNKVKDEEEKMSVKDNMILDLCSLLIALLFCGIHLAA